MCVHTHTEIDTGVSTEMFAYDRGFCRAMLKVNYTRVDGALWNTVLSKVEEKSRTTMRELTGIKLAALSSDVTAQNLIF